MMSETNGHITKPDLLDMTQQIRHEMGTRFDETNRRIEAIDARLKCEASLMTALMDLLTKQTRWHEQSDNAVADLSARHSEFARRLDEMRGKQ